MKKTRLLIIPIGILVVAIVALIVYLGLPSSRCARYTKAGYKNIDDGNFEEAKTCFEKAIEIDADTPKPYIGIAKVHIKVEDYVQAIDAIMDAYDRIEEDQELKKENDDLVLEVLDVWKADNYSLEESESRLSTLNKLHKYLGAKDDYVDELVNSTLALKDDYLKDYRWISALTVLEEEDKYCSSEKIEASIDSIKNRMVVHSTAQSISGLLNTTNCYYDNEGRLREEEHLEGDTKIEQTYYDEWGNTVRFVYYDKDGSVSWGREYKYDDLHNLISERYFSNGQVSSEIEYTNKYDDNGHLIESQSKDRGITTTIKYSYDDKDNCIKKEYEYDGDYTGYYQTASILEVYEYNDDNQLVAYNNVNDSDGELDYTRYEYTYDKFGNKTLEVSDSYGLESIKNYEYMGYSCRYSPVGLGGAWEYDDNNRLIYRATWGYGFVTNTKWVRTDINDYVYIYDKTDLSENGYEQVELKAENKTVCLCTYYVPMIEVLDSYKGLDELSIEETGAGVDATNVENVTDGQEFDSITEYPAACTPYTHGNIELTKENVKEVLNNQLLAYSMHYDTNYKFNYDDYYEEDPYYVALEEFTSIENISKYMNMNLVNAAPNANLFGFESDGKVYVAPSDEACMDYWNPASVTKIDDNNYELNYDWLGYPIKVQFDEERDYYIIVIQ